MKLFENKVKENIICIILNNKSVDIKDRILFIFNNTLCENPPKDWQYYQALGYDGPTDIPPPQIDEYTLNDEGYSLLSSGMKTIMEELLEKSVQENYALAFSCYKLIIRECAKLYKKSIENFLISDRDLVDFILLTSYGARSGLADMAKKAGSDGLNRNIINWLLKEIVRKEYLYNNHFVVLADLLFLLYSTDDAFRIQMSHQIEFLQKEKSYPYKFLLAAVYYTEQDFAALDSLISENLLVFRLMQYIVELHVMDENYDSGLHYALFCLEEHAKDRRFLFRMEDEVRMKRFPEYPGMDLYTMDVRWVIDFVMDTLVGNKRYDEAISFILGQDGKYNAGSIDEYNKLAQILPQDKKERLIERLAEKASCKCVFSSEAICRFINKWQPWVESMKKNSRLYDIMRVFKICKVELEPYHSQILVVFAEKLLKYVEKGSGNDRKVLILETLNEMLNIGMNKEFIFQLIQKMQHEYAGRKLLLGFLDEFIISSGIEEPYKLFLNANKMP